MVSMKSSLCSPDRASLMEGVSGLEPFFAWKREGFLNEEIRREVFSVEVTVY